MKRVPFHDGGAVVMSALAEDLCATNLLVVIIALEKIQGLVRLAEAAARGSIML